jgi:hypothetical protein
MNGESCTILESEKAGSDKGDVSMSLHFDSQCEMLIGSAVMSQKRSSTLETKLDPVYSSLHTPSVRVLHSLGGGEVGKSAVLIKKAARHSDISMSMRYVHMVRTKSNGKWRTPSRSSYQTGFQGKSSSDLQY